MNEFNSRARLWDSNPVHWERSEAIAKYILEMVPIKPEMRALEFGAGTGILGFLLSYSFSEITLMDNSEEMVKIMQEKVQNARQEHITPILFDLEHYDYQTKKFDFICSQMVLHHISDIQKMFGQFYKTLDPGGYLAIADLYSENGSFHGKGFNGHNGFDVIKLQQELEKAGFTHIATKQCYIIKKEIEGALMDFPVFIMVAAKPAT